MNERLKNKFKNLTNALNRLKEVLENKDTEFTIKRDSTIQRFEFTIELFWKFLKTYMEEMGVNEGFIYVGSSSFQIYHMCFGCRDMR